jgi:hypothetical protein
VHLDLWGDVSDRPREVAYCRVAAGLISCLPDNYAGTNRISLAGEMRSTCLRVTGYAQDRSALDGHLTGDEYRVAILARY